jgi:hypothetical protein
MIQTDQKFAVAGGSMCLIQNWSWKDDRREKGIWL